MYDSERKSSRDRRIDRVAASFHHFDASLRCELMHARDHAIVGAFGLHPAARRAQRREDQRDNEHEKSTLKLHDIEPVCPTGERIVQHSSVQNLDQFIHVWNWPGGKPPPYTPAGSPHSAMRGASRDPRPRELMTPVSKSRRMR
jgi:hypothetical protein